jgi:transcriptional pleiotropic regulator of transition state genes
MVKHKRLTSKSGITIPKDLRAETGFFPGMAVDMESTPDGIVIRPHVRVCHFCGSPEGTLTVQNITICHACAEIISQGVKKDAVSG